MKVKFAVILLLFLWAGIARAEDKPRIAQADRIRMAEAFRLGDALGNQIWKDWNRAPFAVLLITPDFEFLLRHPKPSSQFTLLGYDSLLKSEVYFRKRVLSPNLLATFPAVEGSPVSTIVIGQAENTDAKTSTRWVITMLHEHFHQLQNSQPTYYSDVNALNLARGDQSGMWMLNYAFPYKEPRVKQQFEAMSRMLAAALHTKGRSDFSSKLDEYLKARKDFEEMVEPDDYKYFSFQVWQEGIARYTELRVAELAARQYRPTQSFKALQDYTTFSEAARELEDKILKQLAGLQLDKYERSAFYPLGAGEGLLLDRIQTRWRNRYFIEKFYLDKYFPKAK